MQDHIDDDLTPSLHISSAVTMAAATASVILRFCARRKTQSGLGKDDYCLFLGYVSPHALQSLLYRLSSVNVDRCCTRLFQCARSSILLI